MSENRNEKDITSGEIEEGHGTGDTTAAFKEKPDQETIEEIERTRRERLDPRNRPENAEVDNTQKTFDYATGTFLEDHEGEDLEPRFPASGGGA
jgi:hypothetical protein